MGEAMSESVQAGKVRVLISEGCLEGLRWVNNNTTIYHEQSTHTLDTFRNMGI